ncbi:MAG: hypothetical protein SFV32_12640 [Opitutaceae bacterium]|nr:hypothetical protein [Opitutaceae bacterium]
MTKLTFATGIPTEPDVKKLIEKFGTPTAGTKIAYSDIAEVIGEKVGSNRLHTVTTAWRKVLRNTHNILFRSIPNWGFEVMDNSSRILHAANRYKDGLKRISTSAKVAETTPVDGLSEDELRTRNHLSRVAGVIRLAAATEAKKLKSPLG